MKLPWPPRWPSHTPVPDIDVPKVAETVDKAVNAGRISLKRRRASLRPTVVVPYRGWYADGVTYITARCIEKPLFAAGTAGGTREALKANLRRFLVLTIEGVQVRASMGSASAEFTSDGDGYLHIKLPVGPLPPGWHVVDIDPLDSSVPHTEGRFFVPDPQGALAVISDIDDTILKTGLTQRWTAAGRTFLRDVSQRKPVPGMASLYAALSQGQGGAKQAPFFYVSTGSWNYYDYLTAFLKLHGFPTGPLFLTDWGPSSSRLMRDGREHKRTTIRRLIDTMPGYEFVLVGDVGQGDPETYEAIAREFPDRIRAILLVYVGSHLAERSEQVADRAAAVRDEGIPMFYVHDAAEAATAAWQLGLVGHESASAIMGELAR